MSARTCATPVGSEALVAYWLGELAADAEAAVESHYFTCPDCAAQLAAIAQVAAGVRVAVHEGLVRAVITPAFLAFMRGQGMRIREYRLRPGTTVACTIRADDDAVVGRMQADLAGVARVDAIERLALPNGRVTRWRVEDLPFDAAAGEVLTLPCAATLRTMPAHTLHVELIAIAATGERSLGEYTFAHTPS
ncbi:MAG: zf-HC2 domain-containing protein [Burkholderiales bacterium]